MHKAIRAETWKRAHAREHGRDVGRRGHRAQRGALHDRLRRGVPHLELNAGLALRRHEQVAHVLVVDLERARLSGFKTHARIGTAPIVSKN